MDTEKQLELRQKRIQELESEKKILFLKFASINQRKKFSIFGAIILILAISITYYFNQVLSYYLILWFLLVSIGVFTNSNSDAKNRIQEIENDLDLLDTETIKGELRAEKLFKSHQFELKKYYDQTPSHSSWIFKIGLLCLIFGFIILAATMYLIVYKQSESKLDEKILTGIVGIISTILVNFIGAVYLKMYSETISSLKEFHNKLVTTNHLHLSNYLTEKITNQELKDKTIQELALSILRNNSNISIQNIKTEKK